jgi:hypothetical protein
MAFKVKQNFMANGVQGTIGQTLSDQDISKLKDQFEVLKSQGVLEEEGQSSNVTSFQNKEANKSVQLEDTKAESEFKKKKAV